MTDGRVFGNGAEIEFTENGGIIARPADGQKLIVEDDAVVGTLEAESAHITGGEFGVEPYSRQHIADFNDYSSGDTLEIPEEYHDTNFFMIEGINFSGSDSGSANGVGIRINGDDDNNYDYVQRRWDTLREITGDSAFWWETERNTHDRRRYFKAMISRRHSFDGVSVVGFGGGRSVVEGVYESESGDDVTSLSFTINSGADVGQTNGQLWAVEIWP